MAFKCLPHITRDYLKQDLLEDEYPYVTPVLVFGKTINQPPLWGYGNKNEIIFPTIMDAFFDDLSNSVREEDFKHTKREFILGELL